MHLQVCDTSMELLRCTEIWQAESFRFDTTVDRHLACTSIGLQNQDYNRIMRLSDTLKALLIGMQGRKGSMKRYYTSSRTECRARESLQLSEVAILF